MLYLVLKDLLLQRKMLWMMFFYILIFLFSFRSLGDGQIVAIITAVGYMLVMLGGAWEDKNNSDVLLNSLPLPKWKIVGSKYFSILVYVALIVPSYWILATLLSFIGFPLATGTFNLLMVLIGVAVLLINASIYLPFFFAFGYTKSRYLNFILFFAIFFLGSFLMRVIPEKPPWLDPFLERIPEVMETTILPLVAFGGFVSLLVGISFLCSLHLYRRREF